MILIFLVFDSTNTLENTFSGSYYLNCSRVVCSFLLHIMIMPEVRTALELMRYAKQNPKGFNDQSSLYPYLIGVMKMLGGYLTEFVNILLMLES